MVNATKREGAQLLLRFHPRSDLRDRLEAVAQLNSRSLTAEVIHRLEQSLAADGASESKSSSQAKADLGERVSILEAQVAKNAEELQRNDAMFDTIWSDFGDLKDRIEVLEGLFRVLMKKPE